MANITLNCLIIPSGQFNVLPRQRVEVTITIPRNTPVNGLQTAIQTELGTPFINIPLDIRQIYYPGSMDERRMQSQALISDYFNGDPPTDLYHIIASPIPPPPNS